MRKILSQEELEKRDTKNKRIMGIVLGLIMLLSTAGYFVFDFSGSKPQTYDYSGVNFKQSSSGGWDFSYGGKNYNTLYTPAETSNISSKISKTMANIYNSQIYFSAIPIEDISQASIREIWRNIGGLTSRTIATFACMDENCSQDYPIKNCASDNIILFKRSLTNYSTITQDQECIIINYAISEEERVADALIFNLMGIK